MNVLSENERLSGNSNDFIINWLSPNEYIFKSHYSSEPAKVYL